VFTNTFGISFGATEVQLICGIQDHPGTDDVTMEEQVGLIFTHPAAKLLQEMLKMLLDELEDAMGAPVLTDLTKLDGLRDIIAANKKKRDDAAAAAKAVDETN
jgi:hypothetical protein